MSTSHRKPPAKIINPTGGSSKSDIVVKGDQIKGASGSKSTNPKTSTKIVHFIIAN